MTALHSPKNLLAVLQFFKSSLNLHLQLFALAWFMVVVTTFMAWVVPHPHNFVQKWWFYGSTHLVFLQALVLTLFAKGLAQAGNAQWVPGWYKAHSQALVVWLLALAIMPFLVSTAFLQLATEPSDSALLPWLVFSVSAAVVVAFLSPFKEPDLRQFLLLVGGIGCLEVLIIGSLHSMYFSSPWLAWTMLRDWPWCVAFGASGIAIVLYKRPVAAKFSTAKEWNWRHLVDACAIGPKLPGQWLRGRRWPLLNVTFLSGIETTQCFVYLAQLPAIIQSGVFVQLNFYWLILVMMCLAVVSDVKFARPSSALLWLPAGLSRQTLGKDMFYLLLRRHALLLALHTLMFSCAILFMNQPLRFLLQPSVVLLAVAYCVFSAGWTAAFYRHKTNKLLRAAALALPAIVVGIPLTVAMFAMRSGPYLISAQTQFTLAVLFALTGWYLGQRHTRHWDQQDFESLVKPVKPRS